MAMRPRALPEVPEQTVVVARAAFRDEALAMRVRDEWGEVFAGDAVMASAALDRLLHRSTVLNIRGESYRLKEKRQAGISWVEPVLEPPVKPSGLGEGKMPTT